MKFLNPFTFKKHRFPNIAYARKDARRYDCTPDKCCWGHTFCLNELDNNAPGYFEILDGPERERGSYRKGHGFLSPPPRLGDEIVIELTGGPSLWFIVEIKNCLDPSDMFFATIAAIGYLYKVEPKKAAQ